MIEHNFKKKYGQNFISDKNLLKAIVEDAQINENDEVLEIGAGLGTLTSEISLKAKKVVSYEIDKDLKEVLEGLKLKNVSFIFNDIMKENIDNIEENFDKDYKIIANLPYYITTPIIFKFLNNSKKLKSLTIMVQKEVAQRIIADKGTKDYGVLSIMIKVFGSAKITRFVNRKLFFPVPNVDSAVVKIEINDKYDFVDKKDFYKFIQACFVMRRKTLKNNLIHSFPARIEKINFLEEKFLNLRPEDFSLDELINIYLNI